MILQVSTIVLESILLKVSRYAQASLFILCLYKGKTVQAITCIVCQCISISMKHTQKQVGVSIYSNICLPSVWVAHERFNDN